MIDEEELEEFLDNLDVTSENFAHIRELFRKATLADIEEEDEETMKAKGSESKRESPTDVLLETALPLATAKAETDTEIVEMFTFMHLTNQADEITEAIDQIENALTSAKQNDQLPLQEEFALDLGKIYFLSEELTTFFTIGQIMVENYTALLLEGEIIEERFQGTNKTEEILQRRLTQKDREQLLLRTGAIDEGLHSKMSRIRNIRNKIAHNLNQAKGLTEADIKKSDICQTVDVIENLIEQCGKSDIELDPDSSRKID